MIQWILLLLCGDVNVVAIRVNVNSVVDDNIGADNYNDDDDLHQQHYIVQCN